MSYVTAYKSDGPIVKDQITSTSGTHPAQKCTQPLTDCSTRVLSEIVHRKDFKNEQVKDDDGIKIDDNVNSNSTNKVQEVMKIDVANDSMTAVDDVDSTMDARDAIEPNVTMPSAKDRDETVSHVDRDSK